MSTAIDVLARFDLIDRIEGVISNFLNADWKGAIGESGFAGIAAELARTLVGANRWRIYISREGDWSGREAERFLRRYGVVVWDRGFTGPDIYFSVKERQANWAEYLLLRRGIPVSGRLYDPKNTIYAQQHAPGDQPPAWADQQKPAESSHSMLDWLRDRLL
jgi:hypothetical protein